MKQKLPVISFIGWHNSGKTTLIRKVVSELKDRGFRVGIIKSTHHKEIISHKPGSDTELYAKDGISHIALIGSNGFIFYGDDDNIKDPLRLAFSLLSGVDIVICEGFKHCDHLPKIEVLSNKNDNGLLKDQVSNVIALVGEKDDKDLANSNIAVFGKEDIKELVDFIISYTHPYKDKERLYLFVNGNFIPLKKYVRESFMGVIEGFIKALKGTKGAKDIEIKILKK